MAERGENVPDSVIAPIGVVGMRAILEERQAAETLASGPFQGSGATTDAMDDLDDSGR